MTKAGRIYYALMMQPPKQPLTRNHSQQVPHWYIPNVTQHNVPNNMINLKKTV